MSLGAGGALAGPSLHHVAVGTPDVEGLARFYARLLGTEERRRQSDQLGLRSIWFDLAGTLLMIERSDSPLPAPPQRAPLGAFLLAFRADAAGRQAFEARARELGASIESRSSFTSYFLDPDGNRIAVSEYEDNP